VSPAIDHGCGVEIGSGLDMMRSALGKQDDPKFMLAFSFYFLMQAFFRIRSAERIDSNERTPERGPVGGGKRIGCLSEKDTMEGVLKNEREKSERSFGTGPATV
jgi:hypothetical protein